MDMQEPPDWASEAIPDGTRPASEKFPHIWLHDAKLDLQTPYFIKGLIPTQSFVLIYGPSGDGKTFWTIDLVTHIASVRQWRGKRVNPGLVVYVAAEAGTSIVRRFMAWQQQNLKDSENPPHLAIITKGANLLNIGEVGELIEKLRQLKTETGSADGLVVVFDTFSRSTPGGDENAAQDVTRAVAAADQIRDELGATTIFVHHTGKDATKGARGHSALFAAADTVVSIVDKVATVEKSRDGAKDDPMPFNLTVIELGEDQDGDMVTTCVVDQLDAAAPAPKRKPLPANAATAFTALQELVAEQGQRLPATSTIPAGANAVAIAAWSDRFRLRYGNDDPAAFRQAMRRAKADLLKLALIQISDPFVWVV